MRYQAALKWLIPFIFVLALFAAGSGLFWPGEGQPVSAVSTRGEAVMLYGRGLYRADTISVAAQMQGNDLITLIAGLPLLAVSTWLAFRGSLRGRLLLTGTLGFFLYTYMSMSMLAAYNELFLVYVALFSMSLFAFILSMMSFDIETLPRHFNDKMPRRGIATVFFIAGGFLTLAWLGRIVPPLLQGTLPVLENTTTLVIQAMDLGLIVPVAFLSAVLLLKRSPWGYLLASVAVMKLMTMGMAVSAMGINMALNGVPDSPAIIIIFLLLTLANLVMAVLLLRSVQTPERQAAAA
ncbi:MAG: hypothetical protein GX491_12605 [Chloroflexi bacterium]|nr:hypothetical protein [Chloroflexota bacterium]